MVLMKFPGRATVLKDGQLQFVYRYRDKVYCQSKGGSIGNELTHQLAACRMIVFIKKLKMRCLELGLK